MPTTVGEALEIEALSGGTTSEAWLAAIVAASNDAIYGWTLDGTIVSWNAEAERLYGHTAEEAVGRSIFMLFPPDRVEPARAVIEAVKRGHAFRQHETVRLRKDGRRIDVAVTVSPILNKEGQVIAASTIARDITERRRAEEVLRESERRIRDIAANFPGVIYRRVLHPDGRLSYAFMSEAANTLLKTEPAAFQAPRPPEEHARRFVAEDRQAWLDALRRSAAELSPFDFEGRVVANDGGVRWVRALANPHRQADGTIVWDGVSLDITEWKRAEAALRESEETLRVAIEGAQLGTWEYDVATGYGRWSERLSAMLGLPPDMTGAGREERHQFIHPDDRARVVAAVEAHVKHGAPYQIEMRFVRPDGTGGWLASYGGTVRDADGTPRRMVGVVQDITERKAAEQRQALLMAELDHRVKNTLATVQSIANHTLPADQPAQTFTGRIAALAQAHGLLAASHWEGARLRALVEQELAPHCGGPGERIAISGEDVLLSPRAAQTVAMAVHELTTNAAKYGALSVPEGRVEIGWTLQDGPAARRLALRWIERGGPPVKPPSRRGFGSRMIEWSVEYELDGEVRLEFHPEGVRCAMDIPLPGGRKPPGALEPQASSSANRGDS